MPGVLFEGQNRNRSIRDLAHQGVGRNMLRLEKTAADIDLAAALTYEKQEVVAPCRGWEGSALVVLPQTRLNQEPSGATAL